MKNDHIFRHPVLLLKAAAAIMYLVMGTLIFLDHNILANMVNGLSPLYIRLLAILVFVYGLFRAYRLRKDYLQLFRTDEVQ
jgi:hypothetical protein